MKRDVDWMVVIVVLVFIGVICYWIQSLKKVPVQPEIVPSVTTIVERPKDILVEYKLVGGVAGFNDRLIIYLDGKGLYVNDRTQKQEYFEIDTETFEELKSWYQKYSVFLYEYEDNPNRPDNLYTKITFYGLGSERIEGTERINLEKILTMLLAQKGRSIN